MDIWTWFMFVGVVVAWCAIADLLKGLLKWVRHGHCDKVDREQPPCDNVQESSPRVNEKADALRAVQTWMLATVSGCRTYEEFRDKVYTYWGRDYEHMGRWWKGWKKDEE